MRKSTIRHEHLKEVINKLKNSPDMENESEETFIRLFAELKHSCLLVAGNIEGDEIKMLVASIPGMKFGMLFTDMDEYMKVFPDFSTNVIEQPFAVYYDHLIKSDLDGFIINFKSECFILPKDGIEDLGDMPEFLYSNKDSYTSQELKTLKDSINNASLESFIENPKNIGRYEELFEEISSSTMLTLMLSDDDLTEHAVDGVIRQDQTNPLGYLYVDKMGGDYATVYTSEEKMKCINTDANKYSQIVNFSQLTNFTLNDDMDGIIINPESDNILLTRDTLLAFSPLLEKTCNYSRLNSAIFHMFLMEG